MKSNLLTDCIAYWVLGILYTVSVSKNILDTEYWLMLTFRGYPGIRGYCLSLINAL